jgi:hypothetical protein
MLTLRRRPIHRGAKVEGREGVREGARLRVNVGLEPTRKQRWTSHLALQQSR